jgi:hypothetical protein
MPISWCVISRPTKAQRDLALVAFRQKALDIAHLDVVVTIIRTRAELDFLDFNDRLLGFRLRRLLSAPGT